MPLSVAVLGDALLDVSVAPREPMRRGGDVPATVRLAPGGQGSNVAVRLARRGVRTRLACGLAEDEAGRLLRAAIERESVEVLAAAVPSSGAVAIFIEDGERTMLSDRAPFAAGIDVASLASGADWLLISGYVLLEEHALNLARRCAALDVRRAVLGCDVPADRLGEWREAVSAARPDVVFLNSHEGEALEGTGDLDALVVVTARGRVAATGPGVAVSVAGHSASDDAVDSTGAGDAFAAAVIAELGTRWPADVETLRAVLAAAMGAARRVVGVPGAQGIVDGERVATP